MRFCPLEKCEHYNTATKYPSKCYYGEPMCWKGYVDMGIALLVWLAYDIRDKILRRGGEG